MGFFGKKIADTSKDAKEAEALKARVAELEEELKAMKKEVKVAHRASVTGDMIARGAGAPRNAFEGRRPTAPPLTLATSARRDRSFASRCSTQQLL